MKNKTIDPIQGEIIHEYDGILEADNALPLWWVAVFALSTIFAIGYWWYYQVYEVSPNPHAAYAAEAEEAAAKSGRNISAEALVNLSKEASTVESGRVVFVQNCVVCHGDKAEGKIGPNLTDPFWIHGGAPDKVYNILYDGVAAKGMPAWGPVLGASKVQALAAYVLSVGGTNVPGKEPQGERTP